MHQPFARLELTEPWGATRRSTLGRIDPHGWTHHPRVSSTEAEASGMKVSSKFELAGEQFTNISVFASMREARAVHKLRGRLKLGLAVGSGSAATFLRLLVDLTVTVRSGALGKLCFCLFLFKLVNKLGIITVLFILGCTSKTLEINQSHILRDFCTFCLNDFQRWKLCWKASSSSQSVPVPVLQFKKNPSPIASKLQYHLRNPA